MHMQGNRQIKQVVGENIAAARAACGLTQRALAQAIDSDTPEVSKWERGLHKPHDEKLAAIGERLGRDIAWFYVDRAHAETKTSWAGDSELPQVA